MIFNKVYYSKKSFFKIRVTPDTELAGYPGMFLPDTGYPAKYMKITKMFSLTANKIKCSRFIFISNFLYYEYPANETGYPAEYKIPKKAGYPLQPLKCIFS